MIMSVMLKELNVPRDASLRSTCCSVISGDGFAREESCWE